MNEKFTLTAIVENGLKPISIKTVKGEFSFDMMHDIWMELCKKNVDSGIYELDISIVNYRLSIDVKLLEPIYA